MENGTKKLPRLYVIFLIPSRLFLAASRPTNKPPNWICQSNFMLCHDTVLTERFWYGVNKKCVSYLVQYSIAIHHIPYSGVNCPTKMKCKDKSMTKLGLPINLHTLTRQSQLICGILFHDGYSFALDHAPIGHMAVIDLRSETTCRLDEINANW